MVGSKAKLLVGRDTYIVHDFGKPFPSDPFSDLPHHRRKKTVEAMILGKRLIFTGFRDGDDIGLFPFTCKETKFEHCVNNTCQGDNGRFGEVFQCFVQNLVGTWGFLRLKASDDDSNFVWIGVADEFVDVWFFLSKIFDGFVVCVGFDVGLALVLRPVCEGGGFVLICENDDVVRGVNRWKWPLVASQGFGHFPGRWVFSVQGLDSLSPLLVPKIEQCFRDFPLKAVRYSLVASFFGSSRVSSRSVLFPDLIRFTIRWGKVGRLKGRAGRRTETASVEARIRPRVASSIFSVL